MTCNNQQSFHFLTIFEQHVTSAHPHCFRDSFVRDMCCKRPKWWPTSHHPGQLAGIEIFAQGTIFDKNNRQCNECLSPWHICVVFGFFATKIGLLTCARAMKKWWIHHSCGDVHGCRRFFTMPVCVLFGDFSMYPHNKKIGQCHATI